MCPAGGEKGVLFHFEISLGIDLSRLEVGVSEKVLDGHERNA